MFTKDLVKRVIREAADGIDRLSDEECVELINEGELTNDQCRALQRVFGYGEDMAIEPEEIEYLLQERLDFSDKFISELTGGRGLKALRQRARWLSEEYLKPDLTDDRRLRTGAEIRNMGELATNAMPALAKMIDRASLGTCQDVKIARDAIYQLGEMGDRLRDMPSKTDEERAARDKARSVLEPAVAAMAKLLEMEMGDPYEDQLSYMIGSAKATAIVTLGKIGMKNVAAPVLAKMLSAEHKPLRPLAVEAIIALGAQERLYDIIIAWQDLLSRAEEDHDSLVEADYDLNDAIKQLFKDWKVPDKRIVQNLILILEGDKGEDLKTRIYAAKALGGLGPRAAEADLALIERLNADEPAELKNEVARALVSIGTKEAFAALRKTNTEPARRALAESLSSDNAKWRRAAAILLGVMNAQDDFAVEALIAVLENEAEEAEIRKFAAESLGKIGRKEALPALTKALAAGGEVTIACAKAIGVFGADARKAVKPLIESYKRGDIEIKRACAQALGRIGPRAKRAYKHLLTSFDQSDVTLIEACTKAMFNIDASRTVREIKAMGSNAVFLIPLLIEGLAKASDDVKVACAQALGNFGSNAVEAVGPLIAALTNGSKKVKKAAATALGRIGGWAGDAVPILYSEMEASDDDSFRMQAVLAIGRIGLESEFTVPALLTAMSSYSKRISKKAKLALAVFDKVELAKAMVPAIGSGNLLVAKEAAKYLLGMKEDGLVAIPGLIELLDSDIAEARIAAAYVLGEMGEPAISAVPRLEELTEDEADEVKKAARSALAKLGVEQEPEPEPAPQPSDTVDEGSGALPPVAPEPAPEPAVEPQPVPEQPAQPAAPEAPAVPTDIDGWLAWLGGSDTVARLKAAKAIVEMGGQARKAVPGITKLLGHSDPGVRAAAAYTLGELGGVASSSIPSLYMCFNLESDPKVKRTMDMALGKLSTKDAIDGCVAALDSKTEIIRQAAIYVLTRIGPPAEKGAAKKLIAIMEDESRGEQTRVMAIEALKAMGSEQAADAMAWTLATDDLAVRMAVVGALVSLGDRAKAAKATLVKLAGSDDAQISSAAQYLLGKLGI